MPWVIEMKDGKHCVYKKGAGGKATGKSLGCHDSHEKAEKQRKALYASEAMSAPMHIINVFSDQDRKRINSGEPVWIHAAPFGDTVHPIYGEVVLDELKFNRMIENFKSNIVGHELPINYEHFGMDTSKGFKAAGWIKEVELRDDGLWYLVAFTSNAAKEVEDGEWRYFSFEYDDLFEDNENRLHLDVLRGGALTNNPYWGNMTPLNYSSLLLEHPELMDEHKEIEHSEPAGGEPEEREQESDQNTERRHRLDTPPHILEEEGSMEEFLKQLRAQLGLSETATQEQIVEAIKASEPVSFSGLATALELPEDATLEQITEKVDEINEELQPIRDADERASKKKSFRETFPAEYEEHQRLLKVDRENQAKSFSGNYSRFAKTKTGEDGAETVERSTNGFSARTLEAIEEAHLALGSKSFSVEHLKNVLDSIAEVGIVDYGETGSARIGESPEIDPKEPRKAFADKVEEYMEKDELPRRTAFARVAEEHPDLYEAYRSPVHSRTASS
jgi:hypothetical protein